MNNKKSSTIIPGVWGMAVRNIGRRPRRSVMSALAIGIAAAVMVFFSALLTGMRNDMADNVQRWFTGQVLVEHKLFARGGVNALGRNVPLGPAVLDSLQAVPGVQTLSPRISSAASVFVDGDAVFFPFMGLDFDTDPMQIERYLGAGGALPRRGEPEALVSTGLARKLGIKVGDHITALTRTMGGAINGMTFLVTGVAGANMSQFQGPYLYTSLQAAQDFAGTGTVATSILVHAEDGADLALLASNLQGALGKVGLADIAAINWKDSSATWQLFGLVDILYGFFALFFYALASTVIINTMLMVVLERQKEIGTLAAMGMEPRGILSLFVAESAVLSAIGSACGVIAGVVVTLVLGATGIDLSDVMQGMSMEISSVIRPALTGFEPLQVFVGATLVATAFTILPTRQIMRMKVVDALKAEQ